MWGLSLADILFQELNIFGSCYVGYLQTEDDILGRFFLDGWGGVLWSDVIMAAYLIGSYIDSYYTPYHYYCTINISKSMRCRLAIAVSHYTRRVGEDTDL